MNFGRIKVIIKTTKTISRAILVIKADPDQAMPGPGFFKLAEKMGKFKNTRNETEQMVFFSNELNEVRKFWKAKEKIVG